MTPRMQSPMESLLHPELHRFHGSLGPLSLVWPLPSLPSYDRLVPLFVAGGCVKGMHCRFLTVGKFVTHRHLLEYRCSRLSFSSHTRLRLNCYRPISFLRIRCSRLF